jgi:hypothetical protein
METLTLTCPDCGLQFDFTPPSVKFLERGVKKDYAPARCPKGHVHVYEIVAREPTEQRKPSSG